MHKGVTPCSWSQLCELAPGDAVSEITVYCNFIVYRSRWETEQHFYVGARWDPLRQMDGARLLPPGKR